MNNFFRKALPIITILFFILIMFSSNILKYSMNEYDNVPKSIEFIINDIESENWIDANNRAEDLSVIWSNVVKKIQFSSERNQIDSFDITIARLHGAIMAKDKSAALAELNEAYKHWDDIGK